ncbi:hypothetical protein D3C87_1971610 [compost metagenome]
MTDTCPVSLDNLKASMNPEDSHYEMRRNINEIRMEKTGQSYYGEAAAHEAASIAAKSRLRQFRRRPVCPNAAYWSL